MSYKKIFDLMVQYTDRFLIAFILLPFIIFSGFKGFDLHITIEKLINPKAKSSQDYFHLKDEFNLGPRINLIAINSSLWNEQELCQYRKWLSELSIQDNYLYSSFSPFNIRETNYQRNQSGIHSLLFNKVYKFNCIVPSNNIFSFSSLNPSPWNHLIFSQENNDFMVELKFNHSDEKNFDSHTIPKLVSEIKKSFNENLPGQNVSWSGDAVYQYWMKIGLKFNNLLNIGIIFIIIICFKIFFGTFKSSLYFFFTLIYSLTILYGLMSFFEVPIDILNNAIILLLTISSLGDFIFLSNWQIKHKNFMIKESFTYMALPSLFTSLTTFIGFISLYSSELEIIKRLGLWCAVSGLIEWATTFILLPAVITRFGKNRVWVNSEKAKALKLNLLNNLNLPKSLAYGLLILFIFIPYAFKNINLKDNPMGLFPLEHEFTKSMDYLRETRNFEGDASIVFNNIDQEALNKERLKTISKHKLIGHIESPYELEEYFTQGLPELTRKTVKSTIRHSNGYKRLVSENQTRAILYLSSTSLFDISELKKYIEENLCPNKECYLTGRLVSYAEFANEVPRTLLDSLIISLTLVALIIIGICYYLKEKQVLKVLLASFWGVAFILCYLALSGVVINFVTCAALSIIVGLTGDNAIQYLLSVRNLDSGVEEKSLASIMTCLIMVLCSGLFLFYYFQPPRDFGVILILGLIGSLIGDLWILKAIKKPLP